MSDSGHVVEHAAGSHASATAEMHPPAAAVATPELPFSERQIDQFDADDGDAGRAIGKMLALFFLYTIIAMSGVAWWTYHRTGAREAAQSAAHAASAKAEPAAQAEE
jgi:hypothetical protein